MTLQAARLLKHIEFVVKCPCRTVTFQQCRFISLTWHLCFDKLHIPAAKLPNTLTASSDASSKSLYIPEPPTADGMLDSSLVYNSLGEPTFASLGLNSWWPSGWFQWLLENLHVAFELPWWSCIAASAVFMRIAAFPFMIQTRLYSNYVPHFFRFQNDLLERMRAAERRNDVIELMLIQRDIVKFHEMMPKVAGILYNRFLPSIFFQAVMNISLFTALRKMANLPVMTMQYGGLYWFIDLTVSDPYFILPAYTAFMIHLMIKLGINSGMNQVNPMSNQAPPFWITNLALYGLPVLVFLFMSNSSSCLCLYWAVSNTITSCQSAILRLPAVKQYLSIKDLTLPAVAEKTKETKKTWKDITGLTEKKRTDYAKINEEAWKRAANDPLEETFDYDPRSGNRKEG